MNHTQLSDLELYELFIAAYPEIYVGQEEDEALWDRVMEHADDVLSDPDEARDFLGRVVMMTNPVRSPLTGRLNHVLGKVRVSGNQVEVQAAVSLLAE